MDNLQVHKTINAKQLYKDLGIFPIFSITYMPDFNPIETCFAQVKRIFCKQRLWALINDVPFDMDEQVDEAFDVVTPELVKRCA